jgi:hypothetical protein
MTVARRIATTLKETKPGPRRLIHLIVKRIGTEAALAFLQQAMEVESAGGMMLPDGSRRRTPGGAFFHLVRTQLPEDVQMKIWGWTAQGKQSAPAASPQPKAAPAQNNIPIIPLPKEGKLTVKITLAGRPTSQIADRGTYVALVMQNKTVPSLPKGLPSPEAVADTTTNYVVMISSKQWRKVAQALTDPEDMLIIEGWPQINSKNNSISVLATSVTTKKQQQAKKQQAAS